MSSAEIFASIDGYPSRAQALALARALQDEGEILSFMNEPGEITVETDQGWNPVPLWSEEERREYYER